MSTDYHHPELTTIHRRLLTACEAMQRLAGDKPFQFTSGAIAELLGFEDRFEAWCIMKDLRDRGLVVLVERGRRGKPSLYRVPGQEP